MSETPITSDTVKFLANALEGTLRSAIPWETTADPSTLIAQLEGEYSLKLEVVSDFDGQADEPDYVLSLLKARRVVFRIDRTDFSVQETKKSFQGYEYPYGVFLDLWKNAYLKANKITEELNEANKILDRMISDNINF